MRCDKCGFVSFDYLSECKKCGVSLLTTRDAMGMMPVKPAVPFFLGTLLRSQEASEARQTDDLLGGAPDSSLPEIEFGDDFELDISTSLNEAAKTPAAGAQGKARPAEHESDFAEIALSDEELTLAIEDGIDEKELEFALEEDLSQARPLPAAPPRVAPAAGVPKAVVEDEEITLDFSDENLEQLFQEEQVTEAEMKKPAAKAAPAPAAVPPVGAEAAEENLVIDLSKDDLANLLQDLEEEPDPGARTVTMPRTKTS